MTVRNRHDRNSDHDGELDLSDTDVDAFWVYPDRTLLTVVLDDLINALPARKGVVFSAVIKRTMEWQLIRGSVRLDAVIGSPSPLVFPGFFTARTVIRKTGSLTRTANAVIRRNQTGSRTANAVIV
jgi:hypothetical protein